MRFIGITRVTDMALVFIGTRQGKGIQHELKNFGMWVTKSVVPNLSRRMFDSMIDLRRAFGCFGPFI